LWHADPLGNNIHLGSVIEIVELPSVAVIRLSSSAGNTLEDAASVLDAMAQLQPRPIGRFDLHLALAELYHDLGRTDQAESEARLAGLAAEEHERQAALDPRLQSRAWGWRPYWNLGTTFDDLGMLHDASEAYLRVLSINSTHVPSRVRLGSVYRQLGEPGEALSVYQQAVEFETENAQLYRLLGETYQGLGLVEEAALAYEEVLRIEPDDEWSDRRIRLLSTAPSEDVPHPLLRSLGMEVALLGYDLYPSRTEASGTLDLTLWFRALSNMDRDYTVFIRLIGPDDHLWAQEDKLLLLNQLPTSEWGLGVVARIDYHLHVPQNAPPGEYAIVVGVYYWATEGRLPMWDEHGHREPNDAVVLSLIEVIPPLPGD
jgi:tetratricopeptide (TPR) repeat protein